MSISENIQAIRQRMADAACGRAVRLVAVSKTVEPARINEAIGCGIDVIGENRVQELLGKEPELLPVEKHLIGALQTNKVRKILGHVSLIHSVDRLELAQEISRLSAASGETAHILIEVNIGGEESKSGVDADSLFILLDGVFGLANISVDGLMCVPPPCSGDEARRYFSRTREMLFSAQKRFDKLGGELSMGMSGDYTEAIREGATMVRIGSAIFGNRVYQ